MGNYIKLFETHSAYNTYITGGDAILPNVSYCEDQNEVHYNPIPSPSGLYLTFDILSDGTVTWTRNGGSNVEKTIYYSTDNGTNWTEISSASSGATINVETGDKLIFKGENTNYSVITDEDYFSRFGGTASFNLYGNILSLFYGDDFAEYTQLPQTQYSSYSHLGKMFYNSKAVSTKNLIVPLDTTNVGEYSYYRMFAYSADLVETPTLFPYEVQYGVFEYCTSLTNVVITNGVTSISGDTFGDCSGLTSVTIPNTVTEIEGGAFGDCTALTEITIPSGVTEIGTYAFEGCTSLASVTVEATTPPILGAYAFSGNANGRKIYVPADSVNAYKAASGWSTYAADIEAIQ